MLWSICEDALELGSLATDPVAAETELPKLVFETALLHEVPVVVPDIHFANWAFSWFMIDAALLTAAFDVLARTSSPATIIMASIGSNFVVLSLLLEY